MLDPSPPGVTGHKPEETNHCVIKGQSRLVSPSEFIHFYKLTQVFLCVCVCVHSGKKKPKSLTGHQDLPFSSALTDWPTDGCSPWISVLCFGAPKNKFHWKFKKEFRALLSDDEGRFLLCLTMNTGQCESSQSTIFSSSTVHLLFKTAIKHAAAAVRVSLSLGDTLLTNHLDFNCFPQRQSFQRQRLTSTNMYVIWVDVTSTAAVVQRTVYATWWHSRRKLAGQTVFCWNFHALRNVQRKFMTTPVIQLSLTGSQKTASKSCVLFLHIFPPLI